MVRLGRLILRESLEPVPPRGALPVWAGGAAAARGGAGPLHAGAEERSPGVGGQQVHQEAARPQPGRHQ